MHRILVPFPKLSNDHACSSRGADRQPARPQNFCAVNESREPRAVCYGDHMAEDLSYGYGRYRDEYDDASEDDAAGYDDSDDDSGYLDAADHDDDGHGYEDDTGLLTDEPVGDERLLTGAMDEPVNEVVDDPAANESPAYERLRRMRRRAGGRPKKKWVVPPDLTHFRLPVFWPVEEPYEAPGPEKE